MKADSGASSITVPAGHGKAVRLRRNEGLQIINTHGTQVVDCWAWNADDLDEFMCMETTRVWNQRLNPITGDSFVTNLRNPILTVIEDTSPGVHDTFMAALRPPALRVTGCQDLPSQLLRQHGRMHARAGRQAAAPDPGIVQHLHEHPGAGGRQLASYPAG